MILIKWYRHHIHRKIYVIYSNLILNTTFASYDSEFFSHHNYFKSHVGHKLTLNSTEKSKREKMKSSLNANTKLLIDSIPKLKQQTKFLSLKHIYFMQFRKKKKKKIEWWRGTYSLVEHNRRQTHHSIGSSLPSFLQFHSSIRTDSLTNDCLVGNSHFLVIVRRTRWLILRISD